MIAPDKLDILRVLLRDEKVYDALCGLRGPDITDLAPDVGVYSDAKRLITGPIRYALGMEPQNVQAMVLSEGNAKKAWEEVSEEDRAELRKFWRNNTHFVVHAHFAMAALGMVDYYHWLVTELFPY